MPPPIVNGTNTSSAARRASSTTVSRLSRRRGDVEEDELVGALGVVERGQLDRVAGVADVDEARALDDAAGVDVQAGDDALVVHRDQPQPDGVVSAAGVSALRLAASVLLSAVRASATVKRRS